MSARAYQTGATTERTAPQRRPPLRARPWPWILVGVLIAALLVSSILAVFGRLPSATEEGPFPFFWPFFPFGFVLVVFVFFGLVRWGWWGWGGYDRGCYEVADAASEILLERFARGEITVDQLRQMQRELDGQRDLRRHAA
ncbi:MAG: hypothetical protein L3J87_05675 [Thermoplasmata archaeon]|nr:hypothetical protein [Thermoplasmata archaeon]MCI4345095.1 hypothetical protein [Thermoplasmata archaeon]